MSDKTASKLVQDVSNEGSQVEANRAIARLYGEVADVVDGEEIGHAIAALSRLAADLQVDLDAEKTKPQAVKS